MAPQGLGRFDEAADAHSRAWGWNSFLKDGHAEATAWLNLETALLAMVRHEEAAAALRLAES
ncbi:hypothetical protein ACGF5O_33420 [Streptomyces sp. NPDC048291]|uniref:hypothetical protein n=1 Tax=Streptomyces sp. NPDC048291 TaxID=3365530 RepID=UPI003720D600